MTEIIHIHQQGYIKTMKTTKSYKIKYAIAIITSIVIGYYVGFYLFSEPLENAGYKHPIYLQLLFFIGITIGSLGQINLFYYVWFLYFSNYPRIAKKNGFKRKGIFSHGMIKIVNNIEYTVYIHGTLSDRNLVFRIRMGLILDYLSKKNKVRFDYEEYIKKYSAYFDNIYEKKKNKTFSFRKIDYFRGVNLTEHFEVIDSIIKMHEVVNSKQE